MHERQVRAFLNLIHGADRSFAGYPNLPVKRRVYMTYDWRNRYAAGLDGLLVEYEIDRSPNEVVVRLVVQNREEWFREHGFRRGLPQEMRRPGYTDGELTIQRIPEERLRPQCLSNVRELKESTGRSLDTWIVHSVHLRNPKLEGRGLGKAMYLKAFEAVSPAIVTSDRCGGGQTSLFAKRVWESLKSRFPHRGTGDELALLV